jgi:uncharacterized surface protein with fasciclin (FAS1) repeats
VKFESHQKGWNEMKSRLLVGVCSLVLMGISGAAAQDSMSMKQDSMSMKQDPMVGGAAMYPTKNIVENAMDSADHTTLVAAVKAAGLVDTLEGPGPFTVFAPTNEAFGKLPMGTVDTLVKPENKEMLTKILTYHVVAGHLSTADLTKMIKEGHGKAELTTVSGGKLWAMEKGGKIELKDEKGGMAMITIPNVYQSNGVIQVVDTVLMPN